MQGQKWRIIVTLTLIAIACYASWDTFRLWTMDQESRQELLERDPDAYKKLVTGSMRLGLDLQGGIHTVVRVKLEDIPVQERDDAVERVKEIIRNRVDPEGVFEPTIQTQGADRIIVDLPGWKDEKRAEQLIGQTARLEFKMLEPMTGVASIIRNIDSVVAKIRGVGLETSAEDLTESELPATGDDSLALALLGLTEEDTSTIDTAATEEDSPDDILSELLGDDSLGEDSLLGAGLDLESRPLSGKFLYPLGNDRTGISWPAFTIPVAEKKGIEKIFAMEEVKVLIPNDIQIAFSTRNSIESNLEVFRLYFLKKEVRFLGEHLEAIRVSVDQFGASTVDFRLSGRPAAQFANLTGNNIDNPLAIVLDDKVESSPFINGRIRNQGQITLGGSASREDANTLAIVLKAGALPAPVEIIEKNLVGPSLGADSISKGLKSSLVGLLLVMLFIGIYYQLSGIIANVALIFNLFFLLAIMAGLGATLTMPGIAGIILTIGIAVDANILIFERIREEMRVGKTVRAAIDSGYSRALGAIIDSHITVMITAGMLFLFGSGPVRGFAVTLFWGVFISFLTAYFITRMIFDLRKNYQKLSI